jgi:hypothetical protein
VRSRNNARTTAIRKPPEPSHAADPAFRAAISRDRQRRRRRSLPICGIRSCAVAHALQGCDVIGPGVVARACSASFSTRRIYGESSNNSTYGLNLDDDRRRSLFLL